MPMTGEQAVFYGPPVKWKSHVWTAIVQSVHVVVMREHRDCVTPSGDHGASFRNQFIQRSDSNLSLDCRCHRGLLS